MSGSFCSLASRTSRLCRIRLVAGTVSAIIRSSYKPDTRKSAQLAICSFSPLYKCVDVDLQARNFMRQMKDGQLAFFYHSNCKEPGIAGLMKVSHTLACHDFKEHYFYIVGCVNGSCLTKVLDLMQNTVF